MRETGAAGGNGAVTQVINRHLLVVFVVLFLEALTLAWLNDYASCARSNDVRGNYNRRGLLLERHTGIPALPLRMLDCVRVIPGK